MIRNIWGRSQIGKAIVFGTMIVGSNPTSPSSLLFSLKKKHNQNMKKLNYKNLGLIIGIVILLNIISEDLLEFHN